MSRIDRKKSKLKRLSPPGYDWKREVDVWKIWDCIAVGFWLVHFAFGLHLRTNALYRQVGDEMVLWKGIYLYYTGTLNVSFSLMLIPLLMACWNIRRRYRYFVTESLSIYTMKRLRSRWEVWIRCLAVPVLEAATIVIRIAVLLGLGYVIYLHACGAMFYKKVRVGRLRGDRSYRKEEGWNPMGRA